MARIVIQGLPTNTASKKTYTYKDIHLDLQSNSLINNNLNQTSEVNDFKADYDVEAIKTSLKTLFNTVPGQKLLNPVYGLDLKKFLFEAVSNTNATKLERIIYSEINTFEPRVVTDKVVVVPSPETLEYIITIQLSVPTLNITSLTLKSSLNNSGYNFI